MKEASRKFNSFELKMKEKEKMTDSKLEGFKAQFTTKFNQMQPLVGNLKKELL